ncbi:MAG: VOC family protein [Planctomycetota bacterium]
MHAKRFYPLFLTAKLGETKAFYVEHFGFEVAMENERYVDLVNGPSKLGFMDPTGEGAPTARGEGLYFCLEVADVDAEHRRLTEAGLRFESAPEDKPWGDRCAVLSDPNGVRVYLYRPLVESEPAVR